MVKGARLGEDEAPSMAWIGPPRAPGDDVIVDVCAFADGAVATLACPARCETRPPRPPDDLRAGPAVATRNTHGTGCTFSAAVAARLAAGDAPRAAIEGAKVYLDAALRASASLNIGRGAHGPLHHGFRHNAWPA